MSTILLLDPVLKLTLYPQTHCPESPMRMRLYILYNYNAIDADMKLT